MRLQYAEERPKLNRILDLTSLTVEEFEVLVPTFDQAFLARMDEWTLDGKPRTARSYTQYKTCPLPTPQDRLLFILCYLKQASTQSFHGTVFGMGQPKANQWIHSLLPALREALAQSGDLPARTRDELEQRLNSISSDQPPPFLSKTELNDRLFARKTKMNKAVVIAARKNVIP